MHHTAAACKLNQAVETVFINKDSEDGRSRCGPAAASNVPGPDSMKALLLGRTKDREIILASKVFNNEGDPQGLEVRRESESDILEFFEAESAVELQRESCDGRLVIDNAVINDDETSEFNSSAQIPRVQLGLRKHTRGTSRLQQTNTGAAAAAGGGVRGAGATLISGSAAELPYSLSEQSFIARLREYKIRKPTNPDDEFLASVDVKTFRSALKRLNVTGTEMASIAEHRKMVKHRINKRENMRRKATTRG